MPAYTNSFGAPQHFEHKILDNGGNLIGTIRLKPNGVLWKPRNHQAYYRVPLETFTGWITDPNTKATKSGS